MQLFSHSFFNRLVVCLGFTAKPWLRLDLDEASEPEKGQKGPQKSQKRLEKAREGTKESVQHKTLTASVLKEHLIVKAQSELWHSRQHDPHLDAAEDLIPKNTARRPHLQQRIRIYVVIV